MSCSGASSWDGAAAGAGTPPGAALQPKKGSDASTRSPTILNPIFISFPPMKSYFSDSRFEQNHTSEFQNKNEGETHVHQFPLTPLHSHTTHSSRLRFEYYNCGSFLVLAWRGDVKAI